MTRCVKIFLVLLGVCLIPLSSSAQQRKGRIHKSNGLRFSFFDSTIDSLESTVMNDGFFHVGSSFMSHVNTLGRDNNVDQWSINPHVGYQKNNLDVYVNGFFWSETTPKWAETDVGISKLWQLSDPLSIQATYEHAFINYGTDDDKFGLTNLISTQFSWTNKFFDLDTRYEYDWGRSQATILELSIGHQVNIYDVFTDDKVEITPRFYLTYLGGNTYPVRLFYPNSLFAAPSPEAFHVAAYEIELPFTWRKIGSSEINLTFTLVFPQNVLPEEGSGNATFFVAASFVKILPFGHGKKH